MGWKINVRSFSLFVKWLTSRITFFCTSSFFLKTKKWKKYSKLIRSCHVSVCCGFILLWINGKILGYLGFPPKISSRRSRKKDLCPQISSTVFPHHHHLFHYNAKYDDVNYVKEKRGKKWWRRRSWTLNKTESWKLINSWLFYEKPTNLHVSLCVRGCWQNRRKWLSFCELFNHLYFFMFFKIAILISPFMRKISHISINLLSTIHPLSTHMKYRSRFFLFFRLLSTGLSVLSRKCSFFII